jgi:hypothetical protein
MTLKRFLVAVFVAAIVLVLLVLVVSALNRLLDGISIVLMCVMVVGAGVVSWVRSKPREES